MHRQSPAQLSRGRPRVEYIPDRCPPRLTDARQSPHLLDQDQAANAAFLAGAGAAETVLQADFTPAFLTKRLAELLAAPQELARRAAAAKSVGVADAAERLADLVLAVANGGDTQGRQA